MANNNEKNETPEVVKSLPETSLADTAKVIDLLDKVGDEEVSQEVKDAIKENIAKPKEKPIWEQYGYPDEKSFRKVYPNAGKSVKKNPRGIN